MLDAAKETRNGPGDPPTCFRRGSGPISDGANNRREIDLREQILDSIEKET